MDKHTYNISDECVTAHRMLLIILSLTHEAIYLLWAVDGDCKQSLLSGQPDGFCTQVVIKFCQGVVDWQAAIV